MLKGQKKLSNYPQMWLRMIDKNHLNNLTECPQKTGICHFLSFRAFIRIFNSNIQ